MVRLAWLLWLLPLAYIIPSSRVLEQLETARKRQPALHLVAELRGGQPGWPTRVEADLHPTFGARFDDGAGGRWVVRGGRPVAQSRPELPAWIPQLEPLVLGTREQLTAWLEGLGADWQVNELGRCGAEDCFVLGGRSGPAQLWIEKDRFEVRRVVGSSGRKSSFEEHRDFDGKRFPGAILVQDGDASLATWALQSVYDVSNLREVDFSQAWGAALNGVRALRFGAPDFERYNDY